MILDETTEQIRDAVRDFAQERLAPGAAERDLTSRFPREELSEMGALGFLGMLVPEAYGGSDLGTLAYALALEEIAAADGACSTIMSVHSSVGCVPILRFGTEEQKQRFLPKLASGEWIGGFALTEPQAGSDASAIRTKARRDGDHYVIDGAKQFITSGKNGNMIIVFAVTDPSAGKKGISAFIVPTDTPGYKVVTVEKKLGLHSSDTCALAFDGMRIRSKTGWAKRVKATRLHSPISKAAASALPRNPSAWRAPPSRPPAPMRMSARPSASRSSSSRPSPSNSPTWQRRSRPPATWSSTLRRSRMPASRVSRKPPWPSSSPRKWPSVSARTPSRSTAVTAICRIIPSNASIGMCASARFTRARAKCSGW